MNLWDPNDQPVPTLTFEMLTIDDEWNKRTSYRNDGHELFFLISLYDSDIVFF
jgi:hypothetical protein